MKKFKVFLSILLPLILLAGASFSNLRRSPLSVFILKGVENNIEAFKIQIFLNAQDSTVETVKLTREQKKQGVEILRMKESRALTAFSRNFGKWPIVIGAPTGEEGWPSYLGGGFNAFIHDGSREYFDNLYWPDRFYLALTTKVPPPPPFASSEIQLDNPTKTSSVPQTTLPSPISTPNAPAPPGLLRVEILNGCGITNAADWVARRMKGPGIVIVDSGNADNFHYPKTIIRSSAGVPVALEEALDRLGISKDSTEEVSSQSSPADVVVIVGRDFQKLKERARERSHH